MNIKVAGLDLAKNVFQLCILSSENKVISNKTITRSKLQDAVRQLPRGTLIAMEACTSAHHWARAFLAMGHEPRIIPTQHVKAFCRTQKNDATDALAICEAAFRPDIHFVPIKTLAQQDIKAILSIRDRMVVQRTALVNQIRGIAAEYGVVFPQRLDKLKAFLPEALEDADNELTAIARRLLRDLADDLRLMSEHLGCLNDELSTLVKQQPQWQALSSIPGLGPVIISSLLAEVGDGSQFSNGRQMSAWLGLVPRQSSSGGKTQLGKISKNGNRRLRTLVIHGARSVIRCGAKKENALGRWLKQLVARRGKNKATVALANKMCRIAWSILTRGGSYDLSKAFHAI
ncbi:IS110 family transposase [Ferrimonas pelagia]|uniref:IS110 family transposase n=1 Tax=Ferrimonas pelagia TaxID=1177826 RepID=A0ABP9EU81_9GAMM